MTRRERIEARISSRLAWATSREKKAQAAFSTAHNIVKDIPFGQPILVGHHSEKRHRRDIDRMAANMDKGCESSKMAELHRSKAANLEHAVDRAIYRDDHDAIERLTAKLAGLEAQRTAMKAENVAYRKGVNAYAAFLGVTVEQAEALRVKIEAGYSWCRQPHPSYSLQNLGGNITRERKRLAELTAIKTPRGAAIVEQSGATATERAGLTITATMTTPIKAWKKPRPVWNVSGNLAFWRPLLVDKLEGSMFRGVVSFWDDPTDQIEAACLECETNAPTNQYDPATVADDADPREEAAAIVSEMLENERANATTEELTQGRTIWNSNGADGPVLLCAPPKD